DLKPENVMVGQFGEVLVMDWGLALDARSDAKREADPLPVAHKSAVTQPLGTPCYMAPELAMGRGDLIGVATDVFLLGAILFEVLSGGPPHEGQSLISVLSLAIQSKAVEFKAPVAAELKAICRKAMAKNPKKRFRSVKAFQSALQSYMKHRESSKIAFEGKVKLEKCQRQVKQLFLKGKSRMTTTERNQIYGEYAESLAAYQQSLMLWSGNKLAAQGVENARFCYARAALDHGDLGLAESLAAKLDPDWPEARVLLKDINSEDKKLKRGRILVWLFAIGMVLLAVSLFFGLIFALVRVNRAREGAERKEREAVAAKKLAEDRQVQATKAKLDAEISRQDAQREKNAALKAREEAEASKMQAISANEQEKKQRRLVEVREKLSSKRAQIAKESLDSIIDEVTKGAQGRGNNNNRISNQTNVKLLEIALKGLERLQESDVESAGDSPAVMKARNQIALAYFALGRYQAAAKSHKQAIELGEKLLLQLSLEDHTVLLQLAICYRSQARTENALSHVAEFRKAFKRSVDLLRRPELKNDLDCQKNLAFSLLEWAIGEDNRFNFRDAVIHYQSAIDCFEKLILKLPNDSAVRINRAYAYSQLGKTQSSLGDFNKAVTTLRTGEKLWAELSRSYPTLSHYRYYWAVALHDLAVAERKDNRLKGTALAHLEMSVQQLKHVVFVMRQNQYRAEYERFVRELTSWKRLR
ncbi:MAG: protein kinase, partial [Planctomycetota bacterium]|nr:protein kinase [Planctomycetota bacterium]